VELSLWAARVGEAGGAAADVHQRLAALATELAATADVVGRFGRLFREAADAAAAASAAHRQLVDAQVWGLSVTACSFLPAISILLLAVGV
jgi:hypothetical protein